MVQLGNNQNSYDIASKAVDKASQQEVLLAELAFTGVRQPPKALSTAS